MSLLRALILASLLIFGALYWWTNLPTERHTEFPSEISKSWPEVLQFARENLSQQGVLQQKPDGFVYLKVDDQYIQTLFPMLSLKEYGFRQPSAFVFHRGPGAHISVFYVDEHVHPKEIGQTFHFNLNRITLVHTSRATFAVLQVDAPDLEKLRIKYGLKPKIHGREFHISIAKKD